MFESIRNFQDKRRERQVEKNLKHLRNPKAMKEDRWRAIEYFAVLSDADIAVPALLSRFEYSLEHGINDSREKEKSLEGIVRHEDKALSHVSKHLRSTTKIAWPIKALSRIGSEEQVIEALKACIDLGDIAFDQAKVDKNFDILCYLRDYQLGGFVEALKKLLVASDERVRYAACEVLIEQDDSSIPEVLEPLLADSSSENTRLRQAVIEAFIRKKWDIKDAQKFSDSMVIPGIRIAPNGLLEKVF